MKKPYSVALAILMVATLFATTFGGCSPAAPSPNEGATQGGEGVTPAPNHKDETIVFADVSWTASTFMSNLAAFIADVGYGYDTEVMTPANVDDLKSIETGDIDVHMDVEARSIGEVYEQVVASGKAEALGVSYTPVWQGWLVPRYMIEGDPARGIEPSLPDVEDIDAIAKYWDLLRDPEDHSKGRFYGCVPGWQCET
jgi:ABC-type proline/glycine betaine transport system substrate-binding protein